MLFSNYKLTFQYVYLIVRVFVNISSVFKELLIDAHHQQTTHIRFFRSENLGPEGTKLKSMIIDNKTIVNKTLFINKHFD
jgi:hypothetical protein